MKNITILNRVKTYAFLSFIALFLFSEGLKAQALSGAYTVDSSLVASSTNFVSISSMATALNTNGVSGPVTITVANNRYYDTLYLGNISGASAVNNIVIDGGGDSSQTIVSHDGSSNYATLTLDGAKYVTFKNMTFEMTKSNSAAVILLKDAEHNTITNCVSRVTFVAAPNTLFNVVFSSSITGVSNNSHSHYNTFKNNRIVGGQYGINAKNAGPNSNAANIGNRAIGNKFNYNAIDSIRQYGVDFMFHDSLEFIGNTVDALSNAKPGNMLNPNPVSYGLQLQTIINSDIKQNYVWSNSASLTIVNSGLSVNNDFVAADLIKRRIEVSNNMLYSKVSKGMYLNIIDSVDIWHNTVNVEGTQPAFHINLSTTYTTLNNDVRNNIFSAKVSEAVLLGSSTNANIIVSDSTMFRKFDNNLYYSATGSTLFHIGTTAYADLATYQQAQPLFNTGSIEADPQFVSATDLHIAGVTPYEGGDNSVGITIDIDGKPRPGPNSTIVNIGADEFIPPACSNIDNAAVSEEDFDAVSFSWVSTSLMPTKEFQYEIFTCDSQLVVTAITSLDSIRVTNLTANSCYIFNVREICTRGDTSSWYTVDFYTLLKTPFFENFEHFVKGNIENPWPYNWTSVLYINGTTSNPRPRWESQVSTGSNQGVSNTGPIYDHTQFGTPGGKYMLAITGTGGLISFPPPPTGDSTDFISAPIYVDSNVNILEFNYSYFMFGNNISRMQVMVDTNGVEEVVAIHSGAQQSSQADNWKDTSIYLHGYQGKEVKLIFRAYKASGGQAGDIAIDDVILKKAPNNDAGVVDFIAQSTAFCAGSNPVTAVIRNYGFDTLKTATVVWDINGVKDSTSFSGLILAGDTAHINLGNITLSSSQINNILIYTSTPNSIADELNDNDTLKLDGIGLGLNGTYTVNAALSASATNFQTLDSLSNYLTANGICGPTTIDVAAGVYNEPLYLENIQGLSATNNLVIDGGDSSQTIVTHDGRKRYATLTISRGANHIHLTNMSFKRTFVASLPDEGAAVLFAYDPGHVTISSSVLWTEQSTSSNQNRHVVAFSGSSSSYLLSATERAKYIVLENNRLVGGYNGIISRPQGLSTYLNVHNQYINNTFDSIYHTAVNLRGQDSLEFVGNNVDMLNASTTQGRGLILENSDNTIVSKNNILAYEYGLTIDNNYRNNPIERRYEISNNMIYSKNKNAMRLSGLDSVDIFHNSFNSEATGSMNTAYGVYLFPTSGSRTISSYDVRNNIFKSKNTKAFSSPESDTIFDNFDHNIFYNTASTLIEIDRIDYPSLSAYLAANAVHNQNSIEADPGFVSNTDLHIDASSTVPAERGDNAVGITTDIDGEFRPYPQTLIVDIGADEYMPTAVPTPYYPIGTINTSNLDGITDSANVEVWTSGTVVGVNLNAGNGLGFTIIDMASNAQEGIFIYSENLVSNYNVSEGDSIKVRGVVGQTNGLTQMEIDFIEVISTGNTIPTPRSVTVLDESTESQYLEIEKFVLLDTSGVGSYQMRAYNGLDTILINIDSLTAVSDSLAEVNNSLVAGDTLCVMLGVGGQYDTSSTAPFLSGYYITPMYYSDLTVCKYIPTPYYPIGTLNTSDMDGVADSINVEAWTSGTVIGVNLNAGNGIGFTLIDMSSGSQEGIYIHSNSAVSSYSVSEGDSIKVLGTVAQSNGLTEFVADSIEVISTGNAIPTPRSVTVLDESTESQYLEIEKFVLLDSSGVGTYSMRAYNGTDTIAININALTDVSDSLADVNNSLLAGDTICVMLGVGGQYDTSSTAPYLSGYYITPMYFTDLTICKDVTIGIAKNAEAVDNLTFYPNPTKGSFSIETSGLENDNAIITIRDISGKVVVSENIINSSSAFKKHYSLEGQAKGLYIISIIDGEKRINKKLILQ